MLDLHRRGRPGGVCGLDALIQDSDLVRVRVRVSAKVGVRVRAMVRVMVRVMVMVRVWRSRRRGVRGP